MAGNFKPVGSSRLDRRLRAALIKLSLAGLLAAVALYLIFQIVQVVANGTQEIAGATQSLRVVNELTQTVSGAEEMLAEDPLADWSVAQQELLSRIDQLTALAPRETEAAITALQDAARTFLGGLQNAAAARPGAPGWEELALQRDAFDAAMQLSVFELERIAQGGLSGLVSKSRVTVSALVAVLGATVFLLITVLMTGFREMQRREAIERELCAAVQRANEASLAKSQFLANITHELRTPLNAIIGYSELLGDEPLSRDQKTQVSRLSSAGQALTRIVDDVLDLSRIEAGAMELRDEAFCPRELVQEAIDLVSVNACAKGLALTSEVGRDVPKLLRGDPLRLSQVLLNLLNNAIKFTPEGFVTLRLTARTVEDGTSQLRFEVQDSGIGISVADQDRLFQRFSQMENGASEYKGGSGLGLSISQGLIEQMGGRVNVFSRLGEGTIFWLHVTLPIVEAEKSDEQTDREPSVPLSEQVNKVMLIDDNEDAADLLSRVLRREGVELVAVPDVLRSLEQVIEQVPDVIFCDMQMPDVSGDEMIRCIRALPKPFGDIPIIGFSATTMKSDIEDMLMAGADGFLSKPFQARDVIDAISAVIGSRLETADSKKEPTMTVADEPEELEELVDLMGADWALQYVERLSSRLEKYFDGGSGAADRISLTHSVVAEAGQLGLRELALSASALEEALRSGSRALNEDARFRNEARSFLSRLPEFTSRLRQMP
ncbi:MAG: ATP-binding protein [Thalassovita sp.]|nr:ATP-binding protein [Thalassovita sp.]